LSSVSLLTGAIKVGDRAPNIHFDKPLGSIEAMRKLGFKVESARRMIDSLAVTRAE